MNKLDLARSLSQQYNRGEMVDVIQAITKQVNRLAEGSIVARYQADTAQPSGSAVSYVQGDIKWNKTPSEAGSAGSKYVILGWVCVASGTPGTFREMRVLTGN